MFKKRCQCLNLIPEIKDGYQFCKDCGKAHIVPRGENSYEHKLENVREFATENHYRITQCKVQQNCSKCGKLFVFNTTIGQYEGKHPDETLCN